MRKISEVIALFGLVFVLIVASANSQELDDTAVAKLSTRVLFGTPEQRQESLEALGERENRDITATLILALRYQGYDPLIGDILSKLTGQKISSWNEAMLWQEARASGVNIGPYDRHCLGVWRGASGAVVRVP